jgi:hypothetical protein
VVPHVTEIPFMNAAAIVTRQRLESIAFEVILKDIERFMLSPKACRGSLSRRSCCCHYTAHNRTHAVQQKISDTITWSAIGVSRAGANHSQNRFTSTKAA